MRLARAFGRCGRYALALSVSMVTHAYGHGGLALNFVGARALALATFGALTRRRAPLTGADAG